MQHSNEALFSYINVYINPPSNFTKKLQSPIEQRTDFLLI